TSPGPGMTASVQPAMNWLKAGWSTSEKLRRRSFHALTSSAALLRCLSLMLLLATVSVSLAAQRTPRTIHVFVALADNKNQGIVPVAARLGNGEDPVNNLYWASAYGVKAYFSHSTDWQLLAAGQKPKPEVLERCIFKHRTQNVYLIADAYQGNKIRQTI